MASHVSVEKLWVKFTGDAGEVQALEDINFEVKPGEFLNDFRAFRLREKHPDSCHRRFSET